MTVILATTLVYCNFFTDTPDNADGTDNGTSQGGEDDGSTEEIPIGYEVGEKCPAFNLELVDGDGAKVSIKDYAGKTIVVNFWGTWCGPCKAELPHFDELANEYSEDVVFLIVHSVSGSANASAYINEHFPDSKMIFAYDVPLDKVRDMYFNLLGGTDYYPRTLVLDKDGVITFTYDGGLSYDALKTQIENALDK
jgi:thiol-disulfide isomerase/thioredoxin